MPAPPAPSSDPRPAHRAELRQLAAFGLGFCLLAAASYLLPGARAVRPWLPGEAIPLVGLATRPVVVKEDAQGDLAQRGQAPAGTPSGASADPAATDLPAAAPDAATLAATDASPLPARPPARPQPLGGPPEALEPFFAQLALAEQGYPGAVVRALHWGDSTIAGDGITGTVRDRLQARFGDAGPGFLAVSVDPRWALRPGIARWTQGEWESLGITFGGAPTAAYGLAGTLATARAEASATLGGRKLGEQDGGDRQLVHRIDVYYQRQPGGGTLSVKPKGAPGATLRTDSGGDRTADAFHMLTSPQGSPTVWIKADGSGPVTVYGVALETAGPGLTWESFGVAGSGQGSILSNQSARHLAGQVARRQPHLVVYQTGGNELGYPSLKNGEGELYLETYGKVLARLRAGAPQAACLVVTPLDQAVRERGQVVSKPMLTRMVALQERAATEAGCAFWDARGAMGGEGSFARWLDHEPRMAWTDLMHLTDEGLEIIGHGLADAIEAAYDAWKLAHPERIPAPYPQAPPAAPAPQAAPAALVPTAPAAG
ncbi:hypothetical protein L6R53_12860 [Myxococcota bacterium]|nr:hypothetical protein [Myxococcota bacterium]